MSASLLILRLHLRCYLLLRASVGEPVVCIDCSDHVDSRAYYDDSPSCGAHLIDFPFSECLDVPHRRLAEEAAVFAIELADAFVSNLKGHS